MTESESKTISGETQIAKDHGNHHDDANDVEDVHPNSPPNGRTAALRAAVSLWVKS
jgi:hypothetical protein